jgi:hypothetical protein
MTLSACMCTCRLSRRREREREREREKELGINRGSYATGLPLRATSLSLQCEPADTGQGGSCPARRTRGSGDRFGIPKPSLPKGEGTSHGARRHEMSRRRFGDGSRTVEGHGTQVSGNIKGGWVSSKPVLCVLFCLLAMVWWMSFSSLSLSLSLTHTHTSVARPPRIHSFGTRKSGYVIGTDRFLSIRPPLCPPRRATWPNGELECSTRPRAPSGGVTQQGVVLTTS